MAERARVTNIDELRLFRKGLCEFIEETQQALLLIRSDISRTQAWLERDCLTHWQQMVKRRTKDLSQARNDLQRKEMTSDRTLEERRALERAKRQLQEAQEKVRTIKRWQKKLPQELDRLIGAVRQVGVMVEQAGPDAVKALDHTIESLESYLALQAPSTGVDRRGSSGGIESDSTDSQESTGESTEPAASVPRSDASKD